MGLTVSLHGISVRLHKEINFWDVTACYVVEHTDVKRTISFLFYNSVCFLCLILFLFFWFISFCSCFPPPLSLLYCSSLCHLLPFLPLFIASSTFFQLLFSTVHFCLLLCFLFLFLSFHLPLTIYLRQCTSFSIVIINEMYFEESWPFLGSEQQFPGHRVTFNVESPYIGFILMSTWVKSKTKFRMYSQPSGRNFDKSLTTCLRASTPVATASKLSSLLVLPEESPMLMSPGKVTLRNFVGFSINFASVFLTNYINNGRRSRQRFVIILLSWHAKDQECFIHDYWNTLTLNWTLVRDLAIRFHVILMLTLKAWQKSVTRFIL